METFINKRQPTDYSHFGNSFFSISPTEFLVCEDHYQEGMVGEGHNWSTLYSVNWETMQRVEMSWKGAKGMYNAICALGGEEVTGHWKKQLWIFIRSISDKVIEEEFERSFNEAISRVI